MTRPSSFVFGLDPVAASILMTVAAFGALRLSELALALDKRHTSARTELIQQSTIDALSEDFEEETGYLGVSGEIPRRLLAQYGKLKKARAGTSENFPLVDALSGSPVSEHQGGVPLTCWLAARTAAIDVIDGALQCRAQRLVAQCKEKGWLDCIRLPQYGTYYLLSKKGAQALTKFFPFATDDYRWEASSIERISAPLHMATATHYLLYRRNQGLNVWSEYALHGTSTGYTLGGAALSTSGAEFSNRFNRRPDGVVRLESGGLEIIEVENAEKPLEIFVTAMGVLSSYPWTVIGREKIERLTFVVPNDSFDALIKKAAVIFFNGSHPSLSLPRFEGEHMMQGSFEEKQQEFLSKIFIHEVTLSRFRGVPLNVVRHESLADLASA